MAKRPTYPSKITRKYQDTLPEDQPHRATPEKLAAANHLETDWTDTTTFKQIAEQAGVGDTTVARAFEQFFGPSDEDHTFYELGEKYRDPEKDEEWTDGLNKYLQARKDGRLDEFKTARNRQSSRETTSNGDEEPTPQNARELELCRLFYDRGVEDTLDQLGIDPDAVNIGNQPI